MIHSEAFVVSEVNGTWGQAIEVPGTAALNAGNAAQVNSVSCGSAGNCSAVGYYSLANSAGLQGFIADEVDGHWGSAFEIPGLAALNAEQALALSVSCPAAGNCSAGGYYVNAMIGQQPFVVSEVNGTWGSATEVKEPGTAVNFEGPAGISSMSCASPGNCGAGGWYSSGYLRAFVVSQVNGTWRTAIKVPGIGRSGTAEVTSVSCASAGNCDAGGVYDSKKPFVASQVNGTWRSVITVAPSTGLFAEVSSVSCPAAGNCSAGGDYAPTGSNHGQAFVVSQVDGHWGGAIKVSGILQADGSGVSSVSCWSAGHCVAGGANLIVFKDGSAFVIGEGDN